MKQLLVAICFLFFSGVNSAAESFNYGLYPGFGFYSVGSPNGDTELKLVIKPIDVFVAYNVGRDSRVWVELNAIDDDFSASTDEIGLAVKSTSLNIQYQWRYRATRSFKPWVGVGIVVSDAEYINRHIVDDSGFLATTYKDVSDNEIAFVISGTAEVKLDFGALIYGFSYQQTLGDGQSGLSFNFGFQF